MEYVAEANLLNLIKKRHQDRTKITKNNWFFRRVQIKNLEKYFTEIILGKNAFSKAEDVSVSNYP